MKKCSGFFISSTIFLTKVSNADRKISRILGSCGFKKKYIFSFETFLLRTLSFYAHANVIHMYLFRKLTLF